MVKDLYGRCLFNFRISVIDSCNLECFYCHREGYCSTSALMTADEIIRITGVAVQFGIKFVKITGGEPLLRDDVLAIISGVNSLEGIKEVSMVSNGRLLTYDKAKTLKDSGLSRVNINLPSIRGDVYCRVTGAHFTDAVEGIDNALKAGLNPVKINMVLLKGVNDKELWKAIEFAQKRGVLLQLIELEPVGLPHESYEKYHFSLDGIIEKLERYAQNVKIRRYMHSRHIYTLDGVDVEVVKPIENTEFCLHCTRIRLTHDGKLKPCLMRNDNIVDILTPLRSGVSDDKLHRIFLKAMKMREPYWKGNTI